MKFEDALRRFCSEQGIRDWCEHAYDRSAWLEIAPEFVDWCTKSLTKRRDDEG
jgi:hypothetical protein